MVRGKSAGVKVVKATGEPGYAASVQLRGATSINASGRSQSPLYIVDGIIIDPSVSGSPMGDINPDDVESIEIIKGASGASEYGARAANGVIAIRTKRGSEVGLGQTRFNFKTEYGYNQLNGSIGTNGSHHYEMDSATQYFIDSATGDPYDPRDNTKTPKPKTLNDAFGTAGIYFSDQSFVWNATGDPTKGSPSRLPDNGGRPGFDHTKRFYADGNYTRNNFSMQRNAQNFNVYVGVSNMGEDGVFGNFIDGFERNTFRLNADVDLPYDIKLGFSSLLSKSVKKEVNAASFFDITFFPWDVDILAKDENGEYYIRPSPKNVTEANPVYQIDMNDRHSTRNRSLLGTTLSWSMTPNLRLGGSLSVDKSARLWRNYYPKGYKTADPSLALNDGNLTKSTTDEESINGNLGLTYATALGDMDLIAKGAYTYESFEYAWHSGNAYKLAVGDVPQLGTGAEKSVSSTDQEVNADAFSIGAQVDYLDRYIVDVNFRQDRSSLFGPENRVNNYNRVSFALRLSEHGFWDPMRGILNEFKLRFSNGTSGNRPAFSQQYETWSVAGGNISKGALGNKKLKPETVTETEMGIDFSVMDKVLVEVTQAKTVAKDQLLQVPLAGFYGYGSQWQNAGTLTSDVFEISVNASILNTRDMSLSLGFNYDTYDQQITDFNMPAYLTSNGQDVFYMKNNTQYGSFWGTVWSTSASELPSGAQDKASEFQVNDDGYLVWVGSGNSWQDGITKQLWGTSTSIGGATYNWGRPIQYKDETGNALHQMGSSVPDFSYSFNGNFRFQGLSVFALFDGQSGGHIYNHTRQWAARDDGSSDNDQYGKSDATKKPTVYYRDFYHVNAPNSWYVEDGTFLKLRELAVKYDLASLVDLRGVGINGLKLGIVGRNLITWTDYKGYDPEVGRTGGQTGSAVNARVDSYTYPNYRTFSFTLDMDF